MIDTTRHDDDKMDSSYIIGFPVLNNRINTDIRVEIVSYIVYHQRIIYQRIIYTDLFKDFESLCNHRYRVYHKSMIKQ